MYSEVRRAPSHESGAGFPRSGVDAGNFSAELTFFGSSSEFFEPIRSFLATLHAKNESYAKNACDMVRLAISER